MAKGYFDTVNIDWPDGIDQAYVRSLQTPSGLNLLDLAQIVDAALTTVNAGVDPLIAALMAPRTTESTAEGGDTGGMRVERSGQYTLPRPQFVEGSAHMLSIAGVQIGLGFTEKALKRITLSKVQRNASAMARALERAFRADVMWRLFNGREVWVDSENKTTSTAPGFAGSGTGTNVFSGVYPNGSAISDPYTLYFRDSSGNRDDVILAALTELQKWHGQDGPFDLIGSATFVAAVQAFGTPNFIANGSALIRPGQGTAEALVDATKYVGVYLGKIRVWVSLTDFTDDVAALFKSYGDFDPLNPLVMRYDDVDGPDAYVRTRGQYPLSEAAALWTYGINVNNRVGAALISIAGSGDYTPPTIAG